MGGVGTRYRADETGAGDETVSCFMTRKLFCSTITSHPIAAEGGQVRFYRFAHMPSMRHSKATREWPSAPIVIPPKWDSIHEVRYGDRTAAGSQYLAGLEQKRAGLGPPTEVVWFRRQGEGVNAAAVT